jgi:hypothetical protein
MLDILAVEEEHAMDMKTHIANVLEAQNMK